MQITTLGIDLAKSVFQLHGVDADGNAVLKRRLRRDAVLDFLLSLSPCLIGWGHALPPTFGRARSVRSATMCA